MWESEVAPLAWTAGGACDESADGHGFFLALRAQAANITLALNTERWERRVRHQLLWSLLYLTSSDLRSDFSNALLRQANMARPQTKQAGSNRAHCNWTGAPGS